VAHGIKQVDGSPTVVAVDVGGTLLKAAAVTSDGVVHVVRRVPTAVAGGPEAVADQVGRLVADVAGTVTRQTGAAPLASGVVVPGVIDCEAGIVRYAVNIGWSNLDLRARVQAVLDAPFVLGHDARAAAIAEATFGAARGVEDFVSVVVGTGIGGCVVLAGTPLAGAHGLAGEIGHIRAVADGPQCNCGQRGCLETVASASAIQRRYRALGGAGADKASDVLRLAQSGQDPVAVAVRDEAVGALASVLTMLQRVIDVDLVVVGGGLCAAGEALLVPLRHGLERSSAFQRAPRLALSGLGPDAGCLGAAVMAWQLLGG
jgi:glucokinase